MRNALILLFLFLNVLAPAQPSFHFHLIEEAEGMPLKDINIIEEDDKGFLWLGGPYGVFRWDGVSATFFSHDPADSSSITYGSISQLHKSRKGGFWVGTNRGGLSYFDLETFKARSWTRKPNTAGSLAGEGVAGIHETQRGDLWVGTDQFALHLLQKGKNEFQVFRPELPRDSSWTFVSAGPLGEITADPAQPGLLWVGSRFGIYAFDTRKEAFQLYPFDDPSQYWYSPRGMKLFMDPDGFLWVGTPMNGLFCFDTRSREWVRRDLIEAAGLGGSKSINAILPYDARWLMIISPQPEIHFFDRLSGASTRISTPFSNLRTAVKTRGGLWWLGAGSGLLQASTNAEPFPFYSFISKLPDPPLNNWQRAFALSRDGNYCYLGTLRGNGLLIWDWRRDTWQTASFRHPLKAHETDLLIDALHTDARGKLWIGTEDGLLEIGPEPGRLRRAEKDAFKGLHITALCSTADTLWVGTQGKGLYHYSISRKTTGRLTEGTGFRPDAIIYSIAAGPEESVWIGHDQGLSCWAPAWGWVHLNRANGGLHHDQVSDLEFDPWGGLWIGTLGGGLHYLDPQQERPWKTTLYRNQEAAGGNIIYELAPTPSGEVWTGCESGLARFNPGSGTFVNYDSRQDLFAKLGALGQLPNGYILSGANRGFHFFHPDSLTHHISAPIPYLRQFRVFDQPRQLNFNEEAQLDYSEDHFTFHLGALNPTIFARNLYMYRLEGHDKDWRYNGERSYISYTHLPAGRYRLLVMAANQHGQWSEETELLRLRVRPPFWRQGWFLALAALMLAGLAYGNYRFFRRQRQLKETQRVIDYFAASAYPHLSVEAVLWDVARHCVASMGFEDCVIYLLDEERKVLVQQAAHGPKSPRPFVIDQPLEIPVGKGIVGTVAFTGKPELVADTRRDRRYITDDRSRLSELAVPIKLEGRVLGVIDSEHSQKGFFQPFHLRALTAIAGVCAARIAQAGAESAIREKERQLLEMDKHVAEAQLSALRAQMNPHFLFNSLNSINWYIIKNRPKEASKYLTKFARLVRMILDHSKCRQIPLSQELEALRLYLEIEAIRFEKEFDYEIRVGEELEGEEIQIPPLILQPYVENAIWHGLLHSERPGRLLVDVRAEDGYLFCAIEDNGIGRQASERLKQESIVPRDSKGMRITAERIRLLHENGEGESPVRIIDLYDENGEAKGTRVEIWLPVE